MRTNSSTLCADSRARERASNDRILRGSNLHNPAPSRTWLELKSYVPSPLWCGLLAILFYAALIVIGSIPGKAETASEIVSDKWLHFCAYAILTALVFGAIRQRAGWRGSGWLRVVITVLIVALLGALDEAIQTRFPYRNASWLDWQVDVMAAIVTATVLTLLQRVSPQFRKHT